MTKLIYFYLGLALVSLTLAAVTANNCGLDGEQEDFAKKIKAILDSHLV